MNELLGFQPSLHTIPFLWMHGEDDARIREVIDAVHQSGCGALCVESRPHPDFLGPKWWQDMDTVLDECKKFGMEIWILDDERFPTGYTAGRADGSPYRVRYLNEMHVDIAGPQVGSSILLNLPVFNRREANSDPIVSVVAAKRIPGKNMDHSTFMNITPDPVEGLIDLTDKVDGDVVYWDVPEGLWRVFIITAHYGLGNERRDKYLNPLTKEGTRILIDTVYEEHYRHYPDEFGKTIKGFFSDEPQFGGGYGYHAVIGRAPDLSLPWSDEVIGIMSETLKTDAVALLPGLWTDIGEMTSKVRYAYMEAVTRLYGKNFCTQIGDWCRAHNVEYMGHVIEENNAHARLGAGTGHYFRSLWGQDFAGIDIVLNGIIPGIKGGSHAQSARQFEADDDFFYYCLAQMAASLSHIDPKKRGRAMCEIFGAYGWQEGLKEMKWLADFMMSRGINVFVPHAFTPKDFPDPDCPPHFYALGQNPQFRHFDRLIKYMNRVSECISDGKSLANVAVLYHAESEWATSDYMKTQEMTKRLTQRQIEADIVPADVLLTAKVEGRRFTVGESSFGALVVPYSAYMAAETARAIAALAENGVKVIFAGGLPCHSSTEQTCIKTILSGCEVMTADEAAEALRTFAAVSASSFEPDLKLYPYRRGDRTYILAFNENINTAIKTKLTVPAAGYRYIYDPFEDVLSEADGSDGVALTLEPYALNIVVLSDTPLPAACVRAETPCAKVALGAWKVWMAESAEYPNFKPADKLTGPGNLNRPDAYPRFSGTVRYETDFSLAKAGSCALELGAVGETAEVFVNGVSAGVKIVPPYSFDLSKFVKAGENALTIEVTNTLVYKMHDGFSAYHAIPASGLIGPVTLTAEE